MLANTADAGGLEYNTADGTLWFIHAVGRHVAVTGDLDILAKLNGALDGIIDAHSHGTRFGIKVDPERRPAAAGRSRVGAHVDGRPRRRAADHATSGQGRRDQRALDQRARDDHRPPHADSVVTPVAGSRSMSSPAARSSSGSRVATICSTSSARRGPTTASIRPNQLLALSLPHAPFHPSAIGGVERPQADRIGRGAAMPSRAAHVTRSALAVAARSRVHRIAPRRARRA